MGIKTVLSLRQAQELFPDFHFEKLHKTVDGVIDTTYMAISKTQTYILKKYEKATPEQQERERKLLKLLKKGNLNVPIHLKTYSNWHLFTFLEGESPLRPKLFHLKQAGRFLAKMHNKTHKSKQMPSAPIIIDIPRNVAKVRHNPLIYHKIKKLNLFDFPNDGIIHGDLFPDNAKFNDTKIGVFDFTEAHNGSFNFDLGVLASSWGLFDYQNRFSSIALLLKTYNQYAPKKISVEQLIESIEAALLFYTLQRYALKKQSPLSTLSYRTLMRRHKKFGLIKRKMKNL
ncbi:MAG: phosphotransferase, partial [Thiovulaceae bacterium]|nr:phosphotransferase [Sulfurimonadaceae bacterium]